MTLLNLFNTGGLTLTISIVAIGLILWFVYQTFRAAKSGGSQQLPGGRTLYDTDPTPIYKIPQFWFAVVVLVLYVVALFVIASDYKGVE